MQRSYGADSSLACAQAMTLSQDSSSFSEDSSDGSDLSAEDSEDDEEDAQHGPTMTLAMSCLWQTSKRSLQLPESRAKILKLETKVH